MRPPVRKSLTPMCYQKGEQKRNTMVFLPFDLLVMVSPEADD